MIDMGLLFLSLFFLDTSLCMTTSPRNSSYTENGSGLFSALLASMANVEVGPDMNS